MNRLLLLPLLLLGFAANAQTATDKPHVGLNRPATEAVAPRVTYRNNRIPTPLYVVDGRVVDSLQLSRINPAQIESVNILKGNQGVAHYGQQASNGVIEIRVKPAPAGH